MWQSWEGSEPPGLADLAPVWRRWAGREQGSGSGSTEAGKPAAPHLSAGKTRALWVRLLADMITPVGVLEAVRIPSPGW